MNSSCVLGYLIWELELEIERRRHGGSVLVACSQLGLRSRLASPANFHVLQRNMCCECNAWSAGERVVQPAHTQDVQDNTVASQRTSPVNVSSIIVHLFELSRTIPTIN